MSGTHVSFLFFLLLLSCGKPKTNTNMGTSFVAFEVPHMSSEQTWFRLSPNWCRETRSLAHAFLSVIETELWSQLYFCLQGINAKSLVNWTYWFCTRDFWSRMFTSLRSNQIFLLSSKCISVGLPLWSNGQSSWLQIQRSGFGSRHYHIFWELVDLQRGPLSLMRTTEKLLGWKNSGSGLETREYGRGDPLRWPRDTLYLQKSALTSPTSDGRSD
jgi:hypothetical protein